jgi:RNA-directed DNA polymerase
LRDGGLFLPVAELGFIAERVDFGDLVLHRRLRVEDGLIVDRGGDFAQTKSSSSLAFELMRQVRHLSIREQAEKLNRVLRAHYAYYGIAGNFRALLQVHRGVERYWAKC